MSALRRLSIRQLERVEAVFDAAFGPTNNPLYQLGALGWFFFWIVIVSGIYLYIFFDTGITEAYRSVESITHTQWYLGGVMRSLHRYASDALLIVMMLHLLREFVLDRFRGARWFAWVTGVPLLWFMFACGVSGYWLVWDTLAQYVAIATTEWFDVLPIFGEPIARNFLNAATLSGRFFTLMVFVHILVPLLMLFLMWVHIQRNAAARVNPPRWLAGGILVSFLVLSFAWPAVSHPVADLDRVVSVVQLDWFLLPIYPVLDHVSGTTVWIAVGAGTLLLFVLPWLPPGRRPAAAVVDLANCNGCARCKADCPFNAISMQPRSDGRAFDLEAVVEADNCVACGVCVGSCPTATPYRRASDLIAGIELPPRPVRALREQVVAQCASATGEARVLVVGCGQGAPLTPLREQGAATIKLPCVGMLPPSFLDFIISRGHADGVMLVGCREGDCHFRLGEPWTQARIAARRDPYLRARVPRERLATAFVGLAGTRAALSALKDFRAKLVQLGPYGRTVSGVTATDARESVNE